MTNLDRKIAGYVKQGYHVTSRTANAAELTKPKKFSFLWAAFWFLFFGVGLLLYLLYYCSKRDQVVYLHSEGRVAAKSRDGKGIPFLKIGLVCLIVAPVIMGCLMVTVVALGGAM